MSLQPIRATQQDVNFVDAVNVSCVELPAGDIRVTMTGAALSMGRAKNYLLRLLNQGGKTTKALQSKGYSGYQIECDISNAGRMGG